MTPVEPFNRIGDSRYGPMIYNKNDVYVGRSIELYGEYAQRATAVYDQILHAGQLIVEINANIGAHTLFFAKKVGPKGRVLAFEPQRILFQTLCGNMALNCVTNVHCWNMAVGAAAGETGVPPLDYHQADNYAGVVLGEYDGGERVPIVTIDSLALPRCDLLKIDVEGNEADVLAGAAETLARHKPMLYVEFGSTTKRNALIRQIDALDYAMHWHKPPLFNADNFAKNPDNVFGETALNNLLCIDKAADSRLTGFDPVDVPDAA